MERDEDVRTACFLALDVLRAQFAGAEIPYKGGLDQGFAFRGRRVPFLNLQSIELPRRSEWLPDRKRLAVRFERFAG